MFSKSFFNPTAFPSFSKISSDWFYTTIGRNKHLFHLVTPSPWPFVSSTAVLSLAVGSAMYFHAYKFGAFISFFGLMLVLFVMYIWWRDVTREATYLGYHNYKVRNGLKLGFILFVASEIMFFFSWFWAYFHASLAPTVELGSIWPPVGFDSLVCLDPLGVPLLNTIVLLMSGVSVTLSHKAIRANNLYIAFISLVITIALGLFFTILQGWEYITASFFISDSVYGSAFYMITGFHGFHVICGTIFLTVCLLRLWNGQLTKDRHIGFEFAIWYWHFVDIVWIFVYTFLYWWGSVFSIF